jgi:hypothetical protein
MEIKKSVSEMEGDQECEKAEKNTEKNKRQIANLWKCSPGKDNEQTSFTTGTITHNNQLSADFRHDENANNKVSAGNQKKEKEEKKNRRRRDRREEDRDRRKIEEGR